MRSTTRTRTRRAIAVGIALAARLAFYDTGRADTSPEAAATLSLLPLPARVVLSGGTLPVDEHFSVAIAGYRDGLLDRSVTRLIQRLRAQTGLPIAPPQTVSGRATLTIRCAAQDPGFLTDEANERYTLDVTPEGATIDAPSTTGTLRGLATFAQLVRTDATGIHAPAVHIEDSPRFPWRGLMLDVSRHFAGPDILHRTLDAMESVKLNVLHLHLSDNEGFRVQSIRYPRLTALASSGGEFYTQAQVRELVAAARDRGIRVVPEFEMPGHVQSILIAYPDLGAGSVPSRAGRSAETMNAALDPTRDATYAFLTGLLGEMGRLFPDRVMHIAGDEVTGAWWRKNQAIQAFMAAQGMSSPHELQAHFTKRMLTILRGLGKTAVVWDEALAADLPKDVVVQAWRSSKMVQRAASAGHRTIVSAGYYLDHGLPASAYYAIDPYDSHAMGISAQMLERVKGTPFEPYVTESMVAADAPALTAADQRMIAGGETALWTELVPASGVEMHTWPRAAAVAERMWSPSDVRDTASMYRRLEVVSTDLELQGSRHRSNSTLALRRLAAAGSLEPVATLASAVEPLRYLGRLMPMLQRFLSGTTVSETYFPPMNRMSDAVPPESVVAREFNQAAHTLVQSGAGTGAVAGVVRARLTAWRDNDEAFVQIAQGSVLLEEAVPLSQDVKALAEAGLESLEAIQSGHPLAADRQTALRARLAPYLQAAAINTSVLGALTSPHAPHGLTVAIVPGVADLVERAAGPK